MKNVKGTTSRINTEGRGRYITDWRIATRYCLSAGWL